MDPITIKLISLGVIAGTFSGLLGIGGGTIIVPTLVVLLGMPLKKAIGVSLAVMVPMIIAGTAKHYSLGNIQFNYAWTIALGGIFGSIFGAWLTSYLPAEVLRKVFAVGLIIVGSAVLLGIPEKHLVKELEQVQE